MRFAHQEDKVNSTLNKISLFLLDKASAINTLIALCKVPITLPWQTSFFFLRRATQTSEGKDDNTSNRVETSQIWMDAFHSCAKEHIKPDEGRISSMIIQETKSSR